MHHMHTTPRAMYAAKIVVLQWSIQSAHASMQVINITTIHNIHDVLIHIQSFLVLVG